jgi:LCP family protein required for cell wall assembly
MRLRRALARPAAGVVLVVAVVLGALALAPDVLAGRDLTDGALDRPPTAAGELVVVLVVGSDSREAVSEDVGTRYGDVTGQRADLVMLVGVVPATGQVRMLSLPRDLQVDIDGHGRQKLAAAYEYGTPAIIRSVRLLTGLPVHHFVGVDFSGLVGLVDHLGGVVVDLPRPARDRSTGFRAGAGRRLLRGEMALAYARSRSYEERQGDRWVPDSGGDLRRIDRQQRLVVAIAARAGSVGPGALLRLLGQLRGHVTVDRRLVPGNLGLLRRLAAGGSGIEARTLPVEAVLPQAARTSPFPPFHLGGVDYLRPREPDASAVLQAFRDHADTTTPGAITDERA